jgi:hypothetical protein
MDRTTPESAELDAAATACVHCGMRACGTQLTWVCSVENGSRRFFCDQCARDNIQGIESRLDSFLW